MALFNLGTAPLGTDGDDNRQAFTLFNSLLVYAGSGTPEAVILNDTDNGWTFAQMKVNAENPTISNDANDAWALGVFLVCTGVTLNPTFSSIAGRTTRLTYLNGDNVLSTGEANSVAKTSVSCHTMSVKAHGSGQRFVFNADMFSYGMGDCAIFSWSNTFAGGPIAGDEGEGLNTVSYLQQQPFLTLLNLTQITQASSTSSTTLTSAITVPSKDPQAVHVADTSFMTEGMWVVVDQPAVFAGYSNVECTQVESIDSATQFTAIMRNKQLNGASVRVALVIRINDPTFVGQQRLLVNLSRPSYSTGQVTSVPSNSSTFNFSGATLTTGIVGGQSWNIGSISLDSDTYTGASQTPFGGTGVNGPLRNWYNILTVPTTSSLTVDSFSVAGSTFYTGNGTTGGPTDYIIRPSVHILRILGNDDQGPTDVVCDATAVTWQVGDSLELAICPYADITGFQYHLQSWTAGGNRRAAMFFINTGSQPFNACYYAGGSSNDGYKGSSYGWRAGFEAQGCRWTVHIVSSTESAIRIEDTDEFTSRIFWANGGYIGYHPSTQGLSLSPVASPGGASVSQFIGYIRTDTGSQGAFLFRGILGVDSSPDLGGTVGVFVWADNGGGGYSTTNMISAIHRKSGAASPFYATFGVDFTAPSLGDITPFFLSPDATGTGPLSDSTADSNFGSIPIRFYCSIWNGAAAVLCYSEFQAVPETGDSADFSVKANFRRVAGDSYSGYVLIDIGTYTPPTNEDTTYPVGTVCNDSTFSYRHTPGGWVRWNIETSWSVVPIPANLAAVGGTGEIALSWDASAGATGYNGQYSSDGGTTWTTLFPTQVGTTFNDSSATSHIQASSGKVYYRVRASISGVFSSYTSSVNASPYIAYTLFPQADGTDINGAALEVGSTWTSIDGTQDVESHKAVSLTGVDASRMVTEVGSATVTVTGIVTIVANGSDNGIILRVTDASNFWLVNVEPTEVAIYKIVAGSFTKLDSKVFAAVTGTPYTIAATFSGNVITATVNGANSMTATDAFNNTATKHGFRLSSPTNTGTSFKVTSP